MTPAARLVGIGVGLALFAGCSYSRVRARHDGDIVRNIEIEGNDWGWLAEDADTWLRDQLEQKPSRFGAFAPFVGGLFSDPSLLDAGALAEDALRIEIFYAHRGWFDAEFQGWNLVQVREPKTRRGRVRRAGVVDVIGVVQPGPRAAVRTLEVDTPAGASKTLVDSAIRNSPLREADPFSLSYVYATRDSVLQTLRNGGYPYATVLPEVQAFPDAGGVDVRLTVEPGIAARFGDVGWSGLTAVPAGKVRGLLPVHDGDRYSGLVVDQARQALFALDTFSVVSVTPDLSDPTRDRVPVQVEVAETRFRTLRLGGGVEYNGFRLTPRAKASLRHTNLFHQLVRGEIEGSYGLSGVLSSGSLAANLTDLDALYRARSSLSVPQLAAGRLDLSASASIEQDLQAAQFLYLRPAADLSASWKASRYTRYAFGPHFERYQIVDFGDGTEGEQARRAASALFGDAFIDRYELFTLDFRFTSDWRDNPLAARRGSFWSLTLRQALPLAVGDFAYTDFTAEVRGYVSPTLTRPWVFTELRRPGFLLSEEERASIPRESAVPVTFGARARLRALQPWSDSGLPYPERVFMGGSADLRGFRDGQVGPYNSLCLYSPSREGDPFTGLPSAGQDVDHRYLPVGGNLGALVTGEVRGDLLPGSGISGVAFVDVGALADGRPSTALVRGAAGVGLRYNSPIGPIRVDLAVRPGVVEDLAPLSYPNCLWEDRLARPYGMTTAYKWLGFHNTSGERTLIPRVTAYDDPSYAVAPIAVQIFLGIGEAF